MNDELTSIIRTVVPYIIGGIVSWLSTKGYHVSDANVASATAWLTFGIGSVYYVVVRFLEKKWPKTGFLLGIATKPIYPLNAPLEPETVASPK